MRRRTVLISSAAVLVVVLAAALVFFVVRSASAPVGSPAPGAASIALSADGVPDDAKIGVIVTLGTAPAGGVEWRDAAEGVTVAAHRFERGDTAITVVAANDGGTADGARAAVRDLLAQKVSGIVVATDGDQVAGAIAEAEAAKVPLVLPYLTGDVDLGDTAWRTSPAAADYGAALTSALGDATAPLLIDAGGGVPPGLRIRAQERFDPVGDTAAFAHAVAFRTGDEKRENDDGTPVAVPAHDRVDAIVVSGCPVLQSAAVRALQQARVSVPVVLTPQATSPAFGVGLQRDGGSTAGTLLTVGPDSGDARALQGGDPGRRMSAYLAAIRDAAASDGTTTLFHDRPFTTVAALADVRAHDAAVALIRAIAAAHSTDPAEVRTALAALKLGAADGIAGDDLDFTGRHASAAPTQTLHMAAQPLGLRPAPPSGPAPVLWFSPGSESGS